MKKIIFWILAIIAVLGIGVGVFFLLNSFGLFDPSEVVSAIPSISPSGSSLSAGGRI